MNRLGVATEPHVDPLMRQASYHRNFDAMSGANTLRDDVSQG
jgi:hypothetical protein